MIKKDEIVWWASENFWKKSAIFITGFMVLVLVLLTFDTVDKITVGSKRVPAYTVINNQPIQNYLANDYTADAKDVKNRH